MSIGSHMQGSEEARGVERERESSPPPFMHVHRRGRWRGSRRKLLPLTYVCMGMGRGSGGRRELDAAEEKGEGTEEERQEKREEKKRIFLLSLTHAYTHAREEERFASPRDEIIIHREKERANGIVFYHH